MGFQKSYKEFKQNIDIRALFLTISVFSCLGLFAFTMIWAIEHEEISAYDYEQIAELAKSYPQIRVKINEYMADGKIISSEKRKIKMEVFEIDKNTFRKLLNPELYKYEYEEK